MGWTALHVLKQNEIWDYSKDAWNNLPNYNIAYMFVSAFNIEGEFLKKNGENTVLGTGGLPSFGIRKNYTEPIDGFVLKFE